MTGTRDLLTSYKNWFSLDSVHILYNKTSEVRFNATEIYAPATSSYHCQHVSSLQKYDTLLVPSTQADGATLQHVTFTDFQIQAFSIQDGQFASATDCASFFTPAILMGLIMSLILLLVLAYALHMVVHLKSIERYDEHKTVYFPKTTKFCPKLYVLWWTHSAKHNKNLIKRQSTQSRQYSFLGKFKITS
uniref:ATPase H+ transporting accessory protein 1 like b n=1 Tax=Erpetoichthys calabaricus TaxID=27687 RepID=A0A8C4XG20_ERPCA